MHNERKALSSNTLPMRPTIAVGLVLALLLALYWPTLVQLWQFWRTDDNYGHGFLVPLVSLYLVWRSRHRLKQIPIKPHVPPVSLLLGALLLYVAGFRGAILFASALSFVLVLTWLLVFFFGKAIVKEISFPLVFLIFMIPIPMLDQLTYPLKAAASRVSAPTIRALGIPVYRDGAMLFLPGFNLEVATACSGLKALVLVTAIGTLYAYLTLDTVWKRLALVVSSVPIALAANIGRIVVVAVLSLKVSSEKLLHFVHDYSGLPVYVIAGILLVATGWGIEWLSRRRHIQSSS
jgi:exosortase